MAAFTKDKASNPVFKRMYKYADVTLDEEKASYQGIAMKTGYFLALVVLGMIAFFVMHNSFANSGMEGQKLNYSAMIYTNEMAIFAGATIITLIAGIIAGFVPSAVPVAGSVYCAGMGYAVTFISFTYAAKYKGIVMEALLLTVLLIGVMLFLYRRGIVKVGSKFRTVLYSALGASVLGSVIYFIIYLIAPNSSLVRDLTAIQYGPLGIVFAFLGVALGALLIVDDFENINQTVSYGLSKKYEWTASYGLVISMIYLYMRILELLFRIYGRKD